MDQLRAAVNAENGRETPEIEVDRPGKRA